MAQSTFRKFTLNEYHKMIETGVLMDGEPYELLEGNLVHKMSCGSPHDAAIQDLTMLLVRMVPTGWTFRGQSAITLPTGSEPKPDGTLVRGNGSAYRGRHPGPGEVGLVVEVSASSLLIYRHDKGRIYAESGIPVYWVVNVVDKVIEVYMQPSGPSATVAYAKCDVYAVGSDVPVTLDGNTIGTISVADVMG